MEVWGEVRFTGKDVRRRARRFYRQARALPQWSGLGCVERNESGLLTTLVQQREANALGVSQIASP